MANMEEGAGQDRAQWVNILQLCNWARSWGDFRLSAVYASTLQLYKVCLLRSPLISDETRLWIFHHGWAAEAGKGSRSSFKESVMQVLWKAGCVESSSERSDRRTHAPITLARLRDHPLSRQQHFPSIFSRLVDRSYSTMWWRACCLCLRGKRPQHWTAARSCVTYLGSVPRVVLLNSLFPSWRGPVSSPCGQQPCSALKESANLYKPFKGKISWDTWIRVWKLLCWSCWHEEKQGVSIWTWWTRRGFLYVNFSASPAHVIILSGIHSR